MSSFDISDGGRALDHTKAPSTTTGRMSMSRLLLFFDAFVGIIITVVASNIVSLEPEDVCKAFEISLQVEGGIGNVTPQAEWPTVCQQPEGNRHHAHKEPPGPPEHASTYPLLPSRNSSSPPSSPGTGAFDFGDCDRAPTVQCLASKKAAFLAIYWASFAALAHTVYLTHLVAFRGVEELPVFPVYFLHICLAVSLGIMPTLVPRLETFTDGVLAIAATLILLELPPVDTANNQTIEAYFGMYSEGVNTAALVMCSIFFLWQSHHRAFEDLPENVSFSTFYNNYMFCFLATLLPVSFDFALFFPHATGAAMLPALPLFLSGTLLALYS
eukprot:g2273.t1